MTRLTERRSNAVSRWMCFMLLALTASVHAGAAAPDDRFATVNGIKLHYLSAGNGPMVVLLHGYAETSRMWLPLMVELAATHRVIAPDLRGAGGSDKPDTGYDKKTMAQDVHALVQSLGAKQITIVGHDIGLMVTYAYAAQYPDQVNKIVLMDAFLPGVGDWTSVWLLRDLWHFHFYGETPLKLVGTARADSLRTLLERFRGRPEALVPEADRVFTPRSTRNRGMRAGFEYFKAFPQDAVDFCEALETKLKMPMLVLTGEKASTISDRARSPRRHQRQRRRHQRSGHWPDGGAPIR